MENLFTIITVCYNAEKLIKGTVDSVLEQTYDNYDYLVVDGTSNDHTIDIVMQEKEKLDINDRLRLIVQKDEGIFDAMNRALDYVRGDSYVIFLNAGDRLFNSSVLQTIAETMRRVERKYDVIYGDVCAVGDNSSDIVPARVYTSLPEKMAFSHQSVFARSDLLKKQRFSMKYKTCADYDQFLKLYLQGASFYYCGIVVSKYLLGGFSSKNPTLLVYECLRVRRDNRVLPLYNPRNALHYLWVYFKLKCKTVMPEKMVETLKRVLK